ncbi:MAG: mechanosensitive ion channel family protein [Bryobacteraceae bacterium]|nr:mechanosensitive ion channel family protein [Bryobacteraceae bacterium]
MILWRQVYLTELAPSSVNFTIYFWVPSPQREALEIRVKLALDEAGIDIPYPHTVVILQGTVS